MVTLARAGYDSALAIGLAESDVATMDDARRRGCRIVNVPGLGREVTPTRDLVALLQLVRLFRRERPELVHTHTSKAGFLGRLAARLARVPTVVHTPHGHVFYGGYYGPALTAAFVQLERIAARWTDRIVVLTERGAEEHLVHGVGRPGQYVAIPSGVDTEALRARAPGREAARAALGLPPEARVVVGIGRLVPVKGFDVLVGSIPSVAGRVPALRVLLVGDGTERSRLEARARALGVEARLAIAGAREDVVPYLAAAA